MHPQIVIDSDRVWLMNMPGRALKDLRRHTTYVADPMMRQAYLLQPEACEGWNGLKRLLHQPETLPPWLPMGLADLAEYRLKTLGISFERIDRRLSIASQLDVPVIGSPIPLFAYQEAAVDILKPHHDGVAELSPRSGKTRLGLELARQLSVGTAWLAPTSPLVEQTLKAARAFFPEHEVQIAVPGNEKKASQALIAVMTYAGVAGLSEAFWKTRRHVVADEAHHLCLDGSWMKDIVRARSHAIATHGLSATFYRSAMDDLELYAAMGPVRYRVTSTQLRDLGRLVPTRFAFLRWQGQRVTGTEFVGKDSVQRRGLWDHPERNALVVQVATQLAYTGRQVIVLVGLKEQGKALVEAIRPLLPRGAPGASLEPCELITGSDHDLRQRALLKAFNERQGVRVLVGTSVLGEGVDLPSADAMVYAQGRKAEVSLTQSWYRVCTAAPGKTDALIVDFADDHNPILRRHAQTRMELARQDPLFTVADVIGLRDLSSWMMQG